jgi:adenylate cyclase
LHRFDALVPPLTFIGTAYASIFTICWFVGAGSGLQFYFLVAACLVVLQSASTVSFLAAALAAIAAGMVITLQFFVPRDTGAQPAWAISACVVVLPTA